MGTSRKSIIIHRAKIFSSLAIFALLLVVFVTGGVTAPGDDVATAPAKVDAPGVQAMSVPVSLNGISDDALAREAFTRYLTGAEISAAEHALISQFRPTFPTNLLEKYDARAENEAADRVHRDVNGPLDDCTTPFPEGAESAVVPALPACWIQVNADASSPTWVTSTSSARTGTKKFSIGWRNPSIDDWLISPGVALEGGVAYQLKFWRRAASSSYQERLDLWYGPTQDVAGMVNSIAGTYSFNSTTYFQDIFTFTPPASGTYHIGWHGTSLDALGIYLDDMELVTAPVAPNLAASLLSPCGTVPPNPAQTVSLRISNSGGSASSPVTANFNFDNGGTTGTAAVPSILPGSYYDVTFATTVNLTGGAHTLSGWFLPHDDPSLDDSVFCNISAQRPCNAMEPADVSLDPLPETPWSGSVIGNCGNGGKWNASFTAVAGRLYHFDLCPDAPGAGTASFDIDIKICNAAGTILAGVDGTCSAQSYRPNDFQWTAPASDTYYVVLAPYSSFSSHTCTGSVSNTFTVQYHEEIPPPPPPNDLCENAIPLALDGESYCGTTVGATDQCSAFPVHEVWHSFTLPQCMSIAIEYCGTITTSQLYYSLYSAGCCAGTAIQNSSVEYTTCADGRVTLHYSNLSAGTYWLPVGFSVQGSYCVAVTMDGPCAPGSECSIPFVIESLPYNDARTTVGQGNNHFPACYGGTNGAPDVAYHYTPAADEWVTLSLCGSAFDTKLAVYDAANVVSGAELYCNDDYCSLQSSLPCIRLTAGITYCIVVDGYGSGSGNYTLNATGCATPATVYIDDGWQSQANVNQFNNQLIWQYDAYNNIPDGISAVGGSTVYVLPGTYPTGIVNITGPVDVVAYDLASPRPLITATTGTGSGGDARGWFVINPGVVVNFTHLAFDGSGQLIHTAVRHHGAGTISGCTFSNIVYAPSSYDGRAVQSDADYPFTVENCQFTNIGRIGTFFFGPNVSAKAYRNNTFTGKGAGDWLDYGVELGGGAVATIENSTLTACTGIAGVDGSSSAAIFGTDYFGPGTNATCSGNVITGNAAAVAIGYAASDATTATVTGNKFDGNDEAAVSTVGSALIEATANWWGSASGPGSMIVLSGSARGIPSDPDGNPARALPSARLDDDVFGSVHYSPWVASSGDDANLVMPGWQPDLSAVGVSTNGTIQQGIDLALPGGTVNIVAGLYNEAVNVNKFVRIIGAGSGVDPAVNTVVTHSAYPNGVFSIIASGNSTAEPLLFRNLHVSAVADYGFAVSTGSQSYVALDNVRVIGTNPMNCTETEVGIYVAGTASLHYLDVANCAFNSVHYGWYFKKDDFPAGGSAVTHVTVTNTDFIGNDIRGFYVEKLSEASFSGCTVQDNGQFYSEACPFTAFGGGFDLNLKGQEAYQNISFTDCDFIDNGQSLREGAALGLKARGTGNDPSYATYPATLNSVTVTGCTFQGNERGVRVGEPGKLNTTPANVSVSGSTLIDNNKLYGGTDGSASGGIVNVTASPTFTVTGNTLSNTANAWDITPGHLYDSNCWSDFTANPGFPSQYAVPGGGANADLGPNPDCGGIGMLVSSTYVGCATACAGDTLYLTFDGTGYITGQLFIQLAPELDAAWADGPQYQNVMPGANASANLVFAAARRWTGNQIELNVQWAPPYSTGNPAQFMAAIPVRNVSGTHCQTLGMAGTSSVFYDIDGPQVNAFLIGAANVRADCEVPAVTFEFAAVPACNAFGAASQLEATLNAGALRGGIPCNSQLESAYVEVNGNPAQRIPLFAGLLEGDYSNVAFPDAAGAALLFGWLNEGCNDLVLHVFDAECNEGTATLVIIRDTTPPALDVIQYQQNACLSDNPLSPTYGGTCLDDLVDIDAALGDGCLAATGTLIISHLGNSYTVPLDVTAFPADDAAALALWNVMKTWISGANGEPCAFGVEATDCAGNMSTGSFVLCVDLTAPANTLTEFDARPTDEGIWLKWAWNHNATQATAMQVWRSDYIANDYPGYPFPNPARWQVLGSSANYPQAYPPAGFSLVVNQDGAAGTTSGAYTGANGKGNVVHSGPGLSYWKDEDASWVDESEDRGVYRYVTFVKDASGNWSQVSGYTLNINADRSTNYWLGDFSREATVSPDPSDGDVFTADLSLLSSVYFTSVPPSPGCYDIGPENAENGIGKGIPTPDGIVNFQDLVPFSFNFGMTGPGTFRFDRPNADPFTRLDEQPVVNVARAQEGLIGVGGTFAVAVSLSGNTGNAVKVAEAELEYDPEVLEFVDATPGVPEVIDGMPFATAKPIPGRNAVGLATAALGETATLFGDAALGVVHFRWKAERVGSTELSLVAYSLADGYGNVVTGAGGALSLGATGVVPSSFALYQNFPNPFNPTTNIRFDLADASDVRLVIYNVMGQEVRTLVAQFMPAGAYNVAWDGLDDSGRMAGSGMYFYRISAGPLNDIKKMLLTR